MIGLVLVCCDEADSARPPSSHLDKRTAPVECQPERRTAMYIRVCDCRSERGKKEWIPPKRPTDRERKRKEAG